MTRGGDNDYEVVELARRLANVVRVGVVAETDLETARLRAVYARDAAGEDVLTAWLPWVAAAAGGRRDWRAPAVGEHVIILAPSGELAQGVVLAGLYSAARPAPEDGAEVSAAHYADGAVVRYDAERHRLSAALPDGGAVEITAAGGVTVRADGGVEITGDVTIAGDIAVSGDIGAGGDITTDGGNVSDAETSMAAMRAAYNRHKHKLTPPDPPPTPRM